MSKFLTQLSATNDACALYCEGELWRVFPASDIAELAAACEAAPGVKAGQSYPQPVRAICPERRMSMDDYLHDADEELQMYEDRDKG